MSPVAGTIGAARDPANTPNRPTSLGTAPAARIARLRPDTAPAPVEEDGTASNRAARRRFVTVLFTDIVGSTRHAARLGDHRWLAMQQAQEAVAITAVRRFRGRVLRTMGDGLLATFGSAMAGVLCAARISEASAAMGIEVRAGLHAGEAECHARRLGGLVFHIGSRIADLATGGQILVSQTVLDLLVGSNLDLGPVGAHKLKGLDGNWKLYELRSREWAVVSPLP